jgi:hypothetical protein
MITVKQFNLEVLSTHKGFFLLDQLPKHATEVDVWVQTPAGNESVDFIDVFSMIDGSLLAAWVHPTQKLPLHNLQVFCDGKVQILNLYTVERILETYDRPTNAEFGVFTFCPSKLIPDGNWRCDKGIYGPVSFTEETISKAIDEVGQIVFYEPFLNVNSIGHIIYLESDKESKAALAVERLNNSVVPVTGRTLQECLRLIYEWSVLAKEPFNSVDQASTLALKFVESLGFTQTELDTIEKLTPMQVSKFISGSDTARLRDMDILPLSEEVADIVFSRMASSTLSFIVSLNPEIFNLNEIVQEELIQLEQGIERFKEYYKLPEGMELADHASVVEHCFIYFPKQLDYVKTQLRGFANKAELLKQAHSGLL